MTGVLVEGVCFLKMSSLFSQRFKSSMVLCGHSLVLASLNKGQDNRMCLGDWGSVVHRCASETIPDDM